MNKESIDKIINTQREWYKRGDSHDVVYRKNALKRLLKAMEDLEADMLNALKADLGKSRQEAYMCEVALVKSEIRFMIRHMGKYSREKRVKTPLAQYISRSFTKPVPYGTVLIMSPWNYPILLSLDPLVDAIAAGNTVVIKPSAYAPESAAVIKKLVEKVFSPEYVAVITGGREENQALLDSKFDYIFFTGSKDVGRIVMDKAAKYLTPVTLELGGKSPCIVDDTAKIDLAAKRIVFGKLVNCGQTCVAPDYIFCHESIKDQLIEALKKQIKKQYGEAPLENPDYGNIINRKHFERVSGLIEDSAAKNKVVFGGKVNAETLQIEPTIIDNASWEDSVMQEEIFGPVIPVMTFGNLNEAAEAINANDTPLALYIFSSSRRNISFAKEYIPFGGGCINDTLIHLATSSMPFGGMGESGMGGYHGRVGFETFSHYKSIVDKKTIIDLPMRYQPYTGFYEKLIRMFVK